MVFKKITASTLLDCYWKSQMKMMQFQMLNMKSLLEGSTNVAFTATDLLLRYPLSGFCILSILKHCNAQRNTSGKWWLRYRFICKYPVQKLRTVSFSHRHIFFMDNFNEHLSLHSKELSNISTISTISTASSYVKQFEQLFRWRELLAKMLKDADIWSQVVTFPPVCYLMEAENLK